MKTIKRNIAAVFFVIVLSTSAVFAEGEMGGGGFAATEDPVKVSQTAADGEMGGGGLTGQTRELDFIDSVLASISSYLNSIL